MAFFHYDGGVVADQATGRPLMGQPVKIFDEETDAPIQAYREGQPVTLVTGAHGLIPQFQTEDSTRRVRIEVGPVRLRQWSQEMIASAAAAGDDISSALEQVEVVRAEAAAIVPRMEQIEAMAGLAPGEVTDAQNANLITRQDTETRNALNAATAEIAVNVSDRVAALSLDSIKGAQDDSARLQAAVNKVSKGSGVPAVNIFAPPGTYRLTRTVVIDRKAVKLFGAGIGNPTDHTNPGEGTTFIWDGPAGQPMFLLKDCQSVVMEDFYIGGNNSNPPSELFYFQNDGAPGQIGTNQHMSFTRIAFGRYGYATATYPNHVKSQFNVRFGGVGVNNDQAWFYDCTFGGATDALVSFDNNMTLWCSFVNPVFDGRESEGDTPPVAAGLRTAANVALYNPQFNRCAPDFDIRGGTAFVHMWNSEMSAQLAKLGTRAGLVVNGGSVVLHNPMGATMIDATGHGTDANISLNDVRVRTALATWPKFKVRGSSSTSPGTINVKNCGIPASAYDVQAGTGSGGIYVTLDDGPVYLREHLRNSEPMPAPITLPLRLDGFAGDDTTISTLVAYLDRAGIIQDRTTATKATRTNALLSPRFIGAGTGWTKSGSTTAVTVGESLELTTTAAISAGNSLAFNTTAAPAAEGQKWSAGVTVKLDGTTAAQTIRAEIKSYPSNTSRGTADLILSPGTQARAYVEGITIPPGDTSCRLSITPLGASLPTGAKVTLSQPILEQSTVSGPFFHGSSTIPGWTAAWTGTVDKSTSTLTPA